MVITFWHKSLLDFLNVDKNLIKILLWEMEITSHDFPYFYNFHLPVSLRTGILGQESSLNGNILQIISTRAYRYLH